MKHLLFILAMVLPLSAFAAGVNTYTVYPTNYAVSGDTITVNGVARTFADSTTASTILTNRTSLAGLMTNVFNAYGSYPVSVSITWGSSTSLVFRGYNLTLTTASGATNWAVIVTNTAPSTNFYAFSGPHYNMPGTNTANVKTNQANDMAAYLDLFVTTNALREAATIVSNLVGRTSTQDVGNKRITNSTLQDSAITNATRIHGTVHVLTNGQYIGPTLRDPTTTNLVNYGDAISSPGSGSSSEQFGTGAAATNSSSLAIGNSALAGGNSSVAAGFGATVLHEFGIAVGASAGANTNAVAVGANAAAQGENAIAIGESATAAYDNSVAIGNGASSGNTNELVLGSSTHITKIAGRVDAATLTNSSVKGQTSISGSVAYDIAVNGNLVNGANASVVLGTNRTVKLMGPTAAYSIAGFETNGIPNGQEYTLILTNVAVATITISHQSGTEPTSGKRIHTGAGDLTSTNNPAILKIFNDRSLPGWRVEYLR